MYSDKVSPMTPDEAMGHNWASPDALLSRMIGNDPFCLKPDGVKFLQAQGLTIKQIGMAFGLPIDQVVQIRNRHDSVGKNKPLTGRQAPITEEKLEAIRTARAIGKSLTQIKNELRVGMSTIYKAIGKTETTPVVLETAPEPEMAEEPSSAVAEPPVLEKPKAVFEAVSVKTYKPLASPEIMIQCRNELEEMLDSLDADTRIAMDDGDYSIACELIRQMQAVSLSIDLISAEIARCG